MHAAAMTQPLACPWRRLDRATRMRITLERRAALVVEDEHTPVPRLDARVFEVERVARLALVGADGAVVEQRVVVAGTRDEFIQRVIEAIEWATSMHAALRLELRYDADPGWQWMCAAVRDAWAQLDEEVCRTALPTTPAELAMDRRRRVA
jgi:hypothetical protein